MAFYQFGKKKFATNFVDNESSNSDSLISSDSDTDLAAAEAHMMAMLNRQPRKFKTRKFDEDVPLNVYKERYRIPIEAMDYLEERLSPILKHTTRRNQSLTPRQQLMVFCHYLGCNSFLHSLRDLFGISKDTSRRVILDVANAILTLKDELVCWPERCEDVAKEFKEIANFPSVIACLDGTHVSVLNPPHREESAFLNRKQTHSLNVLVCSGPDLSFYYVNSRFGGRAHDSRVLKESSLWKMMEVEKKLPFPGAIILADSGYMLRDWLIVPYPSSEGLKERFNTSHCRTRASVERAIGVLKKRFYILSTGIRVRDMKFASNLVTCAVILSNLCIRFRDYGDDLSSEMNDTQAEEGQEPLSPAESVEPSRERDKRRQQILQYFSMI